MWGTSNKPNKQLSLRWASWTSEITGVTYRVLKCSWSTKKPSSALVTAHGGHLPESDPRQLLQKQFPFPAEFTTFVWGVPFEPQHFLRFTIFLCCFSFLTLGIFLSPPESNAVTLHAAGWGKLTRKGHKISLQSNGLFYISFVMVVTVTCALVKPHRANYFNRHIFILAKPGL